MRWQCEHCERSFSKPNALSQHIFQKHPWLRDTSILTSSVEERPVFDELWNAAQSDYDYGVVDELWNIQQSDDRVIDV